MKRSYTIEAQTAPLEHVDESVLGAFSRALNADRQLAGPAAGANTLTRVLSVRTSIDADSPEAAFAVAIARVRLALKRAGVGDVDLSEASVALDLPDDEFASARDDLVGTPEVAARLGISRQRVAQLVEQPGRFPPPVTTVRGTNVWRWGDIVDWVATGHRDLRRKPARDTTIDLIEALRRAVKRGGAKRPAPRRRAKKSA